MFFFLLICNISHCFTFASCLYLHHATLVTSLQTSNNKEKLIFYSDSHWLHPIFEFETFLSENPYNPQELLIEDKIIGRAAALLLVRLNIGKVKARLLSRLAQDIFEQYKIEYTFSKIKDRIACKTEDIRLDIADPAIAYKIISLRIAENRSTQE